MRKASFNFSHEMWVSKIHKKTHNKQQICIEIQYEKMYVLNTNWKLPKHALIHVVIHVIMNSCLNK